MMRTMEAKGQKKKMDKRHVMRLLLNPFDLISPDALLRFFFCISSAALTSLWECWFITQQARKSAPVTPSIEVTAEVECAISQLTYGTNESHPDETFCFTL